MLRDHIDIFIIFRETLNHRISIKPPVSWRPMAREDKHAFPNCINIIATQAAINSEIDKIMCERSRHASRHVRHARAVMHVGIG